MRARSLRQSVEELTNRYIATARYRAEEPVIEPATGMVEETAERPRSFEVPARIRKALVRAPRREGGSENPADTTQQKAPGGHRCVAGDEGYGRGPNPIEERLLKRPLIPNPAAHQNRRQRHRPGSGHVSAIASSPQADQWPYHDWSIRSEGWDRRCRRHGMILTSRVAWTTFQPALEGRTRKIADDVARFALRLLDTPPAAGRLARRRQRQPGCRTGPSQEVRMKPMARFLTLTFTFIAALSLGCDTQQPSGLRSTLALDKSAAGGNGGCPARRAGERGARPANTPAVLS